MWLSESAGDAVASLFIDGQWRRSQGETAPVLDPASGREVGRYALATAADLQQAVESAERAFPGWRRTSAWSRSGLLRQAAANLRAVHAEVARCVVLEQGKTMREARQEVAFACEVIDWCADEARRQYGRVVAAREEGFEHVVLHEPLGVAVLMPSWNMPVLFAARKLAECLGAGCTAVMLGSWQAPGSAAMVLRAFEQAGLPAGVANLVFGRFLEAPTVLLSCPAVRKLSFTGGAATAAQLRLLLADPAVATTFELGGHAPAIVCDDVDPVGTAALLCASKYRNAGQSCNSPTRLYVHHAIHDAFAGALAAAASCLRVGPGLDEASQMGPVAGRGRVEQLQSLVDDAVSTGAQVLAGGAAAAREGAFFAPTVLAGLAADARVLRQEPFGPIACVIPFSDMDEVVRAANALPFGLAAYVHTHRPQRIARLEAELEVALLAVNTSVIALPETPFAGAKASGLGAEGGVEGMAGYLRVKAVTRFHSPC